MTLRSADHSRSGLRPFEHLPRSGKCNEGWSSDLVKPCGFNTVESYISSLRFFENLRDVEIRVRQLDRQSGRSLDSTNNTITKGHSHALSQAGTLCRPQLTSEKFCAQAENSLGVSSQNPDGHD